MKNVSRSHDTFWMDPIRQNCRMNNLEKINKLLLPMSHGNALVERGFSVNGEILFENLHENS